MWRRTIHCGAILTATLFLAGCILIPTDYYSSGYRKNIGEAAPESLTIDSSTREEVLLTLGEPDRISLDETELWYQTQKVKGWFMAISLQGSAGGEIIARYYLIYFFDREGILRERYFDVNL